MKIIFSGRSGEDCLHWQVADPKIVARINTILKEAMRSPFVGIGKPEPLRNEMTGWRSRRISGEHRLVYRVIGKGTEQALEIAACRFHYKT